VSLLKKVEEGNEISYGMSVHLISFHYSLSVFIFIKHSELERGSAAALADF
jgi:hypothetical protein